MGFRVLRLFKASGNDYEPLSPFKRDYRDVLTLGLWVQGLAKKTQTTIMVNQPGKNMERQCNLRPYWGYTGLHRGMQKTMETTTMLGLHITYYTDPFAHSLLT